MRANGNFAISILDTVALTGSRAVNRLLTYQNKNIDGCLAAFLLQMHELFNKETFELPLLRRDCRNHWLYARALFTHSRNLLNMV